jgi:hypothetical protein
MILGVCMSNFDSVPPPPPPSPKSGLSIGWWLFIGACIILVPVIIHSVSSVDSSTQSFSSTSVSSPVNASPPSSSQTSVPSTVETKPAEISINVSALQLWSDYQANEVAADARYKGKVLWVVKIRKTFTDSIVIELATPDEFRNVDAYLQDSESQKAAALSKGDEIIVLCRGNGMAVESPMLSDCQIQ